MPSMSFQKWSTDRAMLLDDIERAHRSVRGTGAGARAASQQVNQAYALLLSAQFQGFCRDLHSECAVHYVAPVTDPDLRQMLLVHLLSARKIDRGNPNPRNIGSDFSRYVSSFWSVIDAHSPLNSARKLALEELNEWRNTIAHQDFAVAMLKAGRPRLTLAQVQNWRRACDGLAQSFDDVMRANVRILTGSFPW